MPHPTSIREARAAWTSVIAVLALCAGLGIAGPEAIADPFVTTQEHQ